MLTPEYTRRRLRGLATATSLAVMLLVPAGAAMAMDTSTAEVDVATGELAGTTFTLEELQTQVADLHLANDALLADNDTLQENVDGLLRERDQLLASLTRFDKLYNPMEADRQILLELRKGLPETRPEAEAQIARIRSLALTADPGRLTQHIDRLDDAAPAFLDWRFGEFANTQEFSQAYIDTGANAFDSSMEEFRSEVLMSVANRLDGLLTILDRIR